MASQNSLNVFFSGRVVAGEMPSEVCDLLLGQTPRGPGLRPLPGWEESKAFRPVAAIATATPPTFRDCSRLLRAGPINRADHRHFRRAAARQGKFPKSLVRHLSTEPPLSQERS